MTATTTPTPCTNRAGRRRRRRAKLTTTPTGLRLTTHPTHKNASATKDHQPAEQPAAAHPVFALDPQPTFEPLTLEQWEQLARIHHTSNHHHTGGLIPANITHLAASLYNDPTALEHSTITAALAAGYLRYAHGRTISRGPLDGQPAAYILTNPGGLYGSPELEQKYPEYWRLTGAFFRNESIAALPEQVWLNTLNLHSYVSSHLHLADGFLSNAHALAQTEPGAGSIFDELKFKQLIEHKVITPTDGGFTLNYWPIIETARDVCLGKLTPPRPDKTALPYLAEETAPPCFTPGASHTLPLEAFGWSLSELTGTTA